MLKKEIKLMLSRLTDKKKDFNKFYKTGYFPYSKDEAFKGAVAIVNDKAIVSFLQDLDDESKAIATATFQDGPTIIFQLMGDNYSRTQFRIPPQEYSSNRESVINEIASVRKHCAEAEERLASSNPHFIKSIFSQSSHSAKKNLSKQDVRFMLESTLDKLHKSRNLNDRNKISPKVETTRVVNSSTPIIDSSDLDKPQEL